MNAISQIDAKAKLLQKEFEQIDQYRLFWTNSLKPFLLEKLNYLVTTVLPDWEVGVDDEWGNLEAISLLMPNRPSGIQEKGTNYVRNFAMSGGT